jgi:protein phosphatase
MKLKLAGLTDVGRVRKNNEDAFFIDEKLGLLIIADGMGGYAAGEVASRIAIDVVRDQVTQGLKTGYIAALGEKPPHLSDKAHLLSSAILAANEVVYALSRQDADKKGMGTTLVAVLVRAGMYAVAHLGDSRLYHFHNKSLRRVTRDHSLVEEQIAQGLITPEEAKNSTGKNILTRALGIGSKVDIDVDEHPLRPGDTLLLCSDGLYRMMEDQTIEEELKILRTPLEMCQNLLAMALDRGGQDNVTVVVGSVGKSGLLERLWRR